jgi:hypothetical protein
MRRPVASMRVIVLVAVLGPIATACGGYSGSPPALRGFDAPASRGSASGCVSASAPGVRAGVGTGRVVVSAGRVVTLQLVEPEAYASSTSGSPPSAFPWLAGHSSDGAGLRPVAFCPNPPMIMSLPFRVYPFRAITPGRYQITAALNPAYHVPHVRPRLGPLYPVRITVVVRAPKMTGPRSPSRLYTVTASVLYRTGMGAPQACLTFLESLPPAGCGGLPVAGFDFQHLSGVIHFRGVGWQTPALRMVGLWTGKVFRLVRPPSTAGAPAREPEPPPTCHGQHTPGTNTLSKRITRAHARLRLLELLPCGHRVWALVAVADQPTRGFIRHHFGRRVIVSGWLRSGRPEK